MSKLNSSSSDENDSTLSKQDSQVQTIDPGVTHFCGGISNCPECRKKYNHDNILSKRAHFGNELRRFFHLGNKKNKTCDVPTSISTNTSNNKPETIALPDNYRVRLSSSILSFSSKCYNSPLPKRILIVIIVGICSGLFGAIFVQNTGLYMSGLSGISQGVARLAHAFLPDQKYDWVYNLLFWGLTIVVNIPMFIFGYFKIGKDFTLLTLVYIITSNLFGLALSNIPHFSEFILIGPNEKGTQLLTWESNESAGKLFSLFFSGIVYSQLTAINYMFIFTVNGSSGGFDFLSVWLAKKKHKSIAKIFTIISCTSMFIGTVFGGYIATCASASSGNTGRWDEVNNYMFTPSLLVSLLTVLCQGVTLNILFPRSKWAKVEIYSDKIVDVRNILISDHHPHAVSIYDITGGYSMKQKKVITTTVVYFEIPRLLSLVRYVDKNCLICISDIKSLDGYVYIYDDSKRGKFRWLHLRKKHASEKVKK